MNILSIKKFSLISVFLTSLSLFPSAWAHKGTDVYGTNTGNCVANPTTCDRVVLQNAINAADKNDVLRLHGIFQMDGLTPIRINKSFLTLVGDTSKDVDGNTIWSTEIRGVLLGTGAPALDLTVTNAMAPFNCDGLMLSPAAGKTLICLRNNGISIDGHPETVKNIEISDLKITGFNRAIVVNGGFSFPRTTNLCSEWVTSGVTITYDPSLPFVYNDIGSGNIKNVSVKNNWFDNSRRGVSAISESIHDFRFENNYLTGNGANNANTNMTGIFVGSFFVACFDADGANSLANNALDIIAFPPDLSNFKVKNNNSNGIFRLAYEVNLKDSVYKNNIINNSASTGIVINGLYQARTTDADTNNLTIRDNVINGVSSGPGIQVIDPNPGTIIAKNTISNVSTASTNTQPYGINFLSDPNATSTFNPGAADVTVCKNTFSNAGVVDVFLNSISHDNTIIGNIFTYTNNGTNNTIIQNSNECGLDDDDDDD